jgi:hypothetical protein
MKTKIISSICITVLILTSGFTPMNNAKTLTDCPPNPRVSIDTDHQNYIHASAFRSLADGYEWTVTGGFIISGQGTTQISMGKDCPSGIITACVRAYNYMPNGGICYSDEVCAGVNYTGPCFQL